MNPSAEFMGWLMAGLAALLGMAAAWKKFAGAPEPRLISPQPLIVKQAEEYARQCDLLTMCADINHRIEDVENRANFNMGLIRSELGALRTSDAAVQAQVNTLVRVTYAMAGKLNVVVPEG